MYIFSIWHPEAIVKKAPLVCEPCGKQKEKTKRGNTIFQTFYLYLPHKTFKE